MSTLGLFEASTRLLWIADRARRRPEEALTNLSHFIDVEFIREAYRRTRKDGAVGVDGQTAADFKERLEDNLRRLVDMHVHERRGVSRLERQRPGRHLVQQDTHRVDIASCVKF